MNNPTRSALVCTALLALSVGARSLLAQNIEVQVSQPGIMVVGGDGSDDGGMIFNTISTDGDGPMMLMGGPDGLGEMFGGPVGTGGVYSFPISTQELERYAKILRFSPEQTTAGTTLLDGYTSAFKIKADDAKKKVTAIREEAKENEDNDAWKKTAPITKELQSDREKAETTFLTDFKSIATKDQLNRWEKIEMYRRRTKAMRGGGFTPFGPAGVRVDLFSIVEALNLSPESQTKLEPIMDTYELDLDARLKERADAQAKQREAMKEAGKNHDFSMFSKMENDRYDSAIKLRDTHRNAVTQLTAALPKDQAARLDLAFHKAVYPRIYRERYAGKAITAATAFDDLTSTQRKDLSELKDRYQASTNDICRRAEAAAIAAEQEAHDKQKSEASAEEGGRVMIRSTFTSTDDDTTAESQRTERRDLEDATVKSLMEILKPEQAERLPTRPGTLAPDESPRATTRTKSH